MDHAIVAGVLDRYAGGAQQVAIVFAIVAQGVELSGDDQGRGQAAKVFRQRRPEAQIAAVDVVGQKLFVVPGDLLAGQEIGLVQQGVGRQAEGEEKVGRRIDQNLQDKIEGTLVTGPLRDDRSELSAGAVALKASSQGLFA